MASRKKTRIIDIGVEGSGGTDTNDDPLAIIKGIWWQEDVETGDLDVHFKLSKMAVRDLGSTESERVSEILESLALELANVLVFQARIGRTLGE